MEVKESYERVSLNAQFPAMLQFVDEDMLKNMHVDQIPTHWHRSIELSMVVEGEIALIVNNEKTIIGQDDFILVNSGFAHQLLKENDSKISVMIVIISYEFLKQVCPEIDNLIFDLNQNEAKKERLKEIYRFFQQYCLNPQVYDEIKVQAYLYEIVYLLLHDFISHDPKVHRHLHIHQRKVLNYIEEHYTEELSLDKMASLFHISGEYFSRRFLKEFGINFKTYLDHYRIYQAYDDIIHSNISMQQIALKHGFSNVKSFINIFKAMYNMTPYQYRKQYIKK